MAGDVIGLDTITRLDLPADKVLDAAKGEVTGGVIVVGYDSNGDLYLASSIADNRDSLWLLEKFKARLLAGDE